MSLQRTGTSLPSSISNAEVEFLDGVSSNIQDQLNTKQAIIAGVSDAEIGYLANVTSDIQAQLNTKLSGTGLVDFTPTGSWSANTTYTGCYFVTSNVMTCWVKVLVSNGAPTSAALTVNMPTGYQLDSSKGLAIGAQLGLATIADTLVASYHGWVQMSTTSVVRIMVGVANGTYFTASSVTQNLPFTFGDADNVQFMFTAPVVAV